MRVIPLMNPEVTVPDVNEPEGVLEKANRLFDALIDVNQRLGTIGNNPAQVQEISQLVMHRGELLNQAQSLDLKNLGADEKQRLSEKLNQYQALDAEIEEKFNTVITVIEKQLKGCHSGKKVLAGYKASMIQSKNTIMGEDA